MGRKPTDTPTDSTLRSRKRRALAELKKEKSRISSRKHYHAKKAKMSRKTKQVLQLTKVLNDGLQKGVETIAKHSFHAMREITDGHQQQGDSKMPARSSDAAASASTTTTVAADNSGRASNGSTGTSVGQSYDGGSGLGQQSAGGSS